MSEYPHPDSFPSGLPRPPSSALLKVNHESQVSSEPGRDGRATKLPLSYFDLFCSVIHLSSLLAHGPARHNPFTAPFSSHAAAACPVLACHGQVS